MQAWHFTEMPYPHASTAENLESMRVTIPSRLYDPKVGSDLYNRYLDEHVIADLVRTPATDEREERENCCPHRPSHGSRDPRSARSCHKSISSVPASRKNG